MLSVFTPLYRTTTRMWSSQRPRERFTLSEYHILCLLILIKNIAIYQNIRTIFYPSDFQDKIKIVKYCGTEDSESK